MSSATKKRIVLRETAQDTFTPSSSQFIARITAGRGNNLHEVVTETDETFLVSMPTKVAEDGILNSVNALVFQYRRTVWMKRGDYVVCEHINEGDKVRAEIVHVFADVRDIDELIRNGLFPQHFIDTDDALKVDCFVCWSMSLKNL
jgi:probable RNA-binding protein EIF1AD